jgi:DNA-binding NtrC family response regulator
MPAMSGLEALAAMKEGHPEAEVIMLTEHASVDTAKEIIRLGGSEYLLKPCPLEEVIAKIKTAFERKLARKSFGPVTIACDGHDSTGRPLIVKIHYITFLSG